MSLDNHDLLGVTQDDEVISVSKDQFVNLLNQVGVKGEAPPGPEGASGQTGITGATGLGVTGYVQLIDTPDELDFPLVALSVNSAGTGIQHVTDRILISGDGVVGAPYTAAICGGNVTAPYSVDIGSSGDMSDSSQILRIHSDGDVNSANTSAAINSTFTELSGTGAVIMQSNEGYLNTSGSDCSIITSANAKVGAFSTIISSSYCQTNGRRNTIMGSRKSRINEFSADQHTYSCITSSYNAHIGTTGPTGSCATIIASGSTGMDINNGTYSAILGSRGGCYISDGSLNSSVNSLNSTITASGSTTITSADVQVNSNYSGIISSTNCQILEETEAPYSSIIASENCQINSGASKMNSIINSSSCQHRTGSYASNILSSKSIQIENNRFSHIGASYDCSIVTSSTGGYNAIMTSKQCGVTGAGPSRSTIISSDGCQISGDCKYASIIGSTDSTCSADYASIIACNSVSNSGEYSLVLCGKDSTYNNTVANAFRAPTLIFNSEMCVSDERKKKNIQKFGNQDLLEKISNIFTYKYLLKSEDDQMPLRTGFMAQDVKEYIPEICIDAGENEWLGIDTTGLSVIIWEAIKSLYLKKKQLRARIQRIQQRV